MKPKSVWIIWREARVHDVIEMICDTKELAEETCRSLNKRTDFYYVENIPLMSESV